MTGVDLWQLIDAAQNDFAKFYVELINTGEELKIGLSRSDNPTNEEKKNLAERFLAVADNLLSKRTIVGEIKRKSEEKNNAEYAIRLKQKNRRKNRRRSG